MLQSSLTHITTLWFLFQLSAVSCQMAPPKQRQWHTATLIDNKLYILGGVYITNASTCINEFFYLDVSGSFNTETLSWQDLSSNTIPPHSSAAAVVGGANNNTLFLYGGYTTNATAALVYTFDPIGKTWNAPKIAGGGGVRKQGLTGIIGSTGKMYLFSGATTNNLTNLNDMLILDTTNLSFGKGSLYNAPVPKLNYGGVLLPDQNIIYLGKQVIFVLTILYSIFNTKYFI
jgi:hypothetical protein